jgi:hypothetical protein
MCSDFVQLVWTDHRGREISQVALLEDVSPEGMCLQAEEPVPPMSPVRLHTRGFDGQAVVLYCERRDCGYQLGVEFAADTGWDRGRWKPKHLLSATWLDACPR